MGAWAKDPVPGAAAGAHPGRRSNITPGTRNSTPGHQNGPRCGAGLSPMCPWAMASCSVLLYYYTLILYYYIILCKSNEFS